MIVERLGQGFANLFKPLTPEQEQLLTNAAKGAAEKQVVLAQQALDNAESTGAPSATVTELQRNLSTAKTLYTYITKFQPSTPISIIMDTVKAQPIPFIYAGGAAILGAVFLFSRKRRAA